MKKEKSPAKLFRAELLKIMPGYKWTIHKRFTGSVRMEATGIITSGFNRLSTLSVKKTITEDQPEYTVKSSGLGKYSPWLAEHTDATLARALRGLQNYYEAMAREYANHADYLEFARAKNQDSGAIQAKLYRNKGNNALALAYKNRLGNYRVTEPGSGTIYTADAFRKTYEAVEGIPVQDAGSAREVPKDEMSELPKP